MLQRLNTWVRRIWPVLPTPCRHVPLVLWCMVWDYLEAQQVLVLRRVCKHWHQLVTTHQCQLNRLIRPVRLPPPIGLHHLWGLKPLEIHILERPPPEPYRWQWFHGQPTLLDHTGRSLTFPLVGWTRLHVNTSVFGIMAPEDEPYQMVCNDRILVFYNETTLRWIDLSDTHASIQSWTGDPLPHFAVCLAELCLHPDKALILYALVSCDERGSRILIEIDLGQGTFRRSLDHICRWHRPQFLYHQHQGYLLESVYCRDHLTCIFSRSDTPTTWLGIARVESLDLKMNVSELVGAPPNSMTGGSVWGASNASFLVVTAKNHRLLVCDMRHGLARLFVDHQLVKDRIHGVLLDENNHFHVLCGVPHRPELQIHTYQLSMI